MHIQYIQDIDNKLNGRRFFTIGYVNNIINVDKF